MKHPKFKGVLLVYDRHEGDHYTTFGISQDMFKKWMRERDEA
jgi:hypothetical protein